MRTDKYVRAAMRRVNRAESEASATVLRAIDRVIAVMHREKTEYLIRQRRMLKTKILTKPA